MDFRDSMIFGQSDGGTFGSFEDSARCWVSIVLLGSPLNWGSQRATKSIQEVLHNWLLVYVNVMFIWFVWNRTIQFWKHDGSIQYKIDPAFGILVEFIPSPRRTSRASSAWALAQRSCDNAKQRWTRMGPCSTWWAALVLWLPLVAIGSTIGCHDLREVSFFLLGNLCGSSLGKIRLISGSIWMEVTWWCPNGAFSSGKLNFANLHMGRGNRGLLPNHDNHGMLLYMRP